MPWYINILVGIIIGGIIFNPKMRKSFLGFLDGFMSKKPDKTVVTKTSHKTAIVDGKKYRLVEDEEEE